MKRFNLIPMFISVIIITMLGCNSTETKTITRTSANFINLTDIHFTPFFDADIVGSLNTYPTEKWDSIFKSSKKSHLSEYNHETNYDLLDKTLNAMKAETDNPDFIILTGDYICHDFGKIYREQTSIMSYEDLHAFIMKTITYVTHKIRDKFPESIIIPTFGNNDSYCGDYHLKNEGKFLNDFSELYEPILGSALPEEESENLRKHGYFCIKNPDNNKHKIIGLNSIYMSVKYFNDSHPWNCNCTDHNVNQDSLVDMQFAWFTEHLEQSKKNGEKVWVITHIPPGVNVYKTIHENNPKKPLEAYLYWKDEYNDQYMNILDKYSDIIFTTMAGHTHMDDFKIHHTATSTSAIHISPSISPVFGNNPAFQIVEYNRNNANFTDYTTYYIDLEKADKAKWKGEYRFTESYPVKDMSAYGYDSLFVYICNNDKYFNNYAKHYGASSTHATQISHGNWAWYNCGISSTLPNQYESCVKH
jgi:hypothetical protein